MKYTDNQQLVNELKKVMIDTDTKQKDFATKLDITKQGVTKLLNKKNLNFDDLKKLLEICDYEIEFNFVPIKKDM